MGPNAEPWRRSAARHVYLAHFRVRFSDLDPLGHVNNAVYLTLLEQAAIDHASTAGFGFEDLKRLGGAFIARRHEIDYLAPARAGDWLRVTTWPEAMSGARAFRCYLMSRLSGEEIVAGIAADGLFPREVGPAPLGDVILRARTEWAYVNFSTGRPQRLPPGIAAEFLDPPR
jgi:acyl-CoA thioester hydrolase